MLDLSRRVLAVTGAASGIGRATAQILVDAGACVSLGDVDSEGLNSLRNSYPQEVQDRIAIFRVDVGDRQNVAAFFAYTMQRFNRIDGLAHVAAIAGPSLSRKHIWEVENAEFQKIYQVNTEGTFNCLSELLTPGVMTDEGSIVVVGSYSGLRGMANTATYGSSKAAVMHLAKCAAIEAAPRKIRVNVVAPGVIDTPMLSGVRTNKAGTAASTLPFPLRRVGEPSEVGNVIAFLLGKESSYITGSIYSVDGGWCV